MTAEDIRQIRHALGWSREDLARALNVRYETVKRWELGKQAPSSLAIRTLQRVLLVPHVAAALSDELRNVGKVPRSPKA